MQVEGFIGAGIGVDVGWPSLGDISFAESPDNLFGPKGYLVTKASLRDCGYVLVSPDEDTEAYSDLDEVDGKLTVPAEAVEAAAKAGCTAIVEIGDGGADAYLAWDEVSEGQRDKMRKMARALIEAALPLLRYEVRE